MRRKSFVWRKEDKQRKHIFRLDRIYLILFILFILIWLAMSVVFFIYPKSLDNGTTILPAPIVRITKLFIWEIHGVHKIFEANL